MGYSCPVCKAKLWRPLFARKLRCPRCGAEVEPAVPLWYFEIVLAVLALVLVVLLVGMIDPRLWLGALLVLVLLFFVLLLPRLVRLQPTERLPLAEGHPADVRLSMPEDGSEEGEQVSFFWFVLVLVACGGIVLLVVLLRWFW
ncbi:MAG: hypothetical protein Kow00109_14800 [Acidobacteriota bacterium]